MSRRKRHHEKQIEDHQIEWLNHRTGYPSPEEREKIIRLRKELSFEFIKLMVLNAQPEDPRVRALFKKYGKDELLRAERVFREGMESPSRVADDARSFRDYRLRYARFGAGLKFYTSKEMNDLYVEHAMQYSAILDSEDMAVIDDENKVGKLMLVGWRDWDDITPPAIPPAPADFDAPPPASYQAPIAEFLEWGANLKKHLDFEDEREYSQWKKHVPALARMALDPGLLNGWPSDLASWAPWHAIHALGNLQAWESAPALAELADLENDWLSDHLPHIWADMGREVEPSLWMILETSSASAKRRALAAEGLYMMSDGNDAMENKAIKGFERILQNTKTFNPTLNGYLISFLQDLEALDDVWDAIDSAFEENRVDSNIVSREDLEEDDDDFEDDDMLDEDDEDDDAN